jgi:hypothetical protein
LIRIIITNTRKVIVTRPVGGSVWIHPEVSVPIRGRDGVVKMKGGFMVMTSRLEHIKCIEVGGKLYADVQPDMLDVLRQNRVEFE